MIGIGEGKRMRVFLVGELEDIMFYYYLFEKQKFGDIYLDVG